MRVFNLRVQYNTEGRRAWTKRHDVIAMARVCKTDPNMLRVLWPGTKEAQTYHRGYFDIVEEIK